MSFGGVVLLYFLYMYALNSLAAYIAHLLAGRRMQCRKLFALQIPVSIVHSFVYAVFIFIPNSPDALIQFVLLSLYKISQILIMVSWVYYLFRDMDKKRRFFYIFITYPFLELATYSTNTLLLILSPETTGASTFHQVYWFAYVVFIYIATSLIVHGGIAGIIRLVSKINFWNRLQSFVDYPKIYIPMGIICFLISYASYFIPSSVVPIPLILFILNLFNLAILIVIVLIVSFIKRTESFNAAQNLLIQQQSYINKLESIQRDIRSIQHDYKNMLTGLYAQASEGNAEAIKEYIDTKLLKVDETVRENLRQMNQLTRIEIPELKGLIMTKMLEAERDNVSFRIEVMFPVNKASMATEDLLRCVGILLDNAIEEARAQKDAAVTLLLLQEDEKLTIVVKNPVRNKPDLTRIWNDGYSTKGLGRGVGLSNYQNIVRKYLGAAQETKIEGEQFVQVLVLTGNR